MKQDQIALQLYTVREHTSQDMLGTLRRLAGIGYRAVEFAGYGNSNPREIRAVLDVLGLRAFAAHTATDLWEKEPERAMDDLHTLGCSFAVVPWVAETMRSTPAQVVALAQRLNRWGAFAQEHNLRLAYHNHAFEFAPLDGTTFWETLTPVLDPSLVGLELDVFWAYYAGRDPVDLIQKNSGRVPLLHAKDMAAGAAREDTPVGAGILPWKNILSAADAAGTEWYIVEQDNPHEPMEDVRRSLENLTRMAEQTT